MDQRGISPGNEETTDSGLFSLVKKHTSAGGGGGGAKEVKGAVCKD